MILLGKTDTGRVRSSNQDNFTLQELSDGRSFAVVCDGMGGYNGGNIASEIATSAIREKLTELLSSSEKAADARSVLAEAIRYANRKVFEVASGDPELTNMGTTAVIVLYEGENRASVSHVGDSRAYRYRKGEFSQLTKDHSLVQMMVDNGSITAEEAREHPYKNVITQVVGKEEDPELSYLSLETEPGDLFLLCSDGLSNMVSDPEIAEILGNQPSADENVCIRLVEAANEAGGTDNITAVILQIPFEV